MSATVSTRSWRPAAWTVLAVGAAVVSGLVAVGSEAIGSATTRAAADVAAVACVGIGLILLLLPLHRVTRHVLRSADRALVVSAGAWVGAMLASIAARTAEAYGRPVTALTPDQLATWTGKLAAGRGLALTAVCAAVVLGLGIARLRTPDRIDARIPLIAALLGVLTPAITGHTGATDDHQLAVLVVAMHAGSAALWVGGLAAILAFVRRRELIALVLPRFSRIATACLIGVTVTGVANVVLRLESVGQLVTTGYGWLVIAKTVGLVALAGLGLVTRRRLAAGRIPLLQWAGVEVASMAVVLGVAATLSQTSP